MCPLGSSRTEAAARLPAVQGLGADPVSDGRPGVVLKPYVW